MAIAQNIRYLRRKQGWGQDILAEKLGYKAYTTVQKWESGVSEPPLKIVHAIAELFHVDINDLVNADLEQIDMFGKEEQPTVSDGLSLDGVSEEDIKTIKAYLSMPEDQRKALAKLLGISE